MNKIANVLMVTVFLLLLQSTSPGGVTVRTFSIQGSSKDTNAATLCKDGEVLTGDGSCIPTPESPVDACGPDEALLGDGTCINVRRLLDAIAELGGLHPRKVFVTSEPAPNGNLGGLDGADGLCMAAAADATPPLAGRFRVWLSDATGSPSTRFEAAGTSRPFELVDGTRIADSWQDLITCDEGPFGDACLDHVIDQDESGDPVSVLIWSNTKVDGTVNVPSQSCQNWTSSAPTGGDGGIGSPTVLVGPGWTELGSASCNNQNPRLVCFEQ